MTSEPDREIQELLDRAGRDAQPQHGGWDALPARLASTKQVPPRRLRPWEISAAAIAAAIAIAMGISFYFATSPDVMAQPGPIRVIRQGIQITIFNETETEGQPLFMPLSQGAEGRWEGRRGGRRGRRLVKSGMAQVKDRRLVMNLRVGNNVVRFSDVAATIDPTSVRFMSETDPLGTTVVEQNFEYDLATASALLKRYIDQKITCVAKDGEAIEGYLCSYDSISIILAERPPRTDGGDRKTQAVSRGELRTVQLPDVPQDLFVKPTLVWIVRTQRPGQHHTMLTYVCGRVKWDADYVLVLAPGDAGLGDQLDLQGWVTIENRSGSAYRDAGIKLIAGDVNRVVDPWAPKPRQVYAGARWGFEDLGFMHGGRARQDGKEFVEKSFFEYHLYTLSAPSTVRDRQIKLLKADKIKAVRRHVFEPKKHASRVRVDVEFKNDKENGLGMPLPKGRIRLMQRDADGDLQLLAQTTIDHTPKDEQMKFVLGYAFDVAAQRTLKNVRTPAERRSIETIELRMRNHKDSAVNGRFVESLVPRRNWQITETTEDWSRDDVNTVHFDFVLGANEEKTITYVVEYQW